MKNERFETDPAVLLAGHRLTRKYTDKKRNAAILLPLVGEPGSQELLFEVRSRQLHQGGEICFPGGRIAPGETPLDAAVRETAEELLIGPEQIRERIPLHVSRGPGGVDVSSYLGILEDYNGTYSPSEVERVFSIPLHELLSMEPEVYDLCLEVKPGEGFPYHRIPYGENYPWRKEPAKIYFYTTDYGTIWGMTARYLFYFLEDLRSAYEGR